MRLRGRQRSSRPRSGSASASVSGGARTVSSRCGGCIRRGERRAERGMGLRLDVVANHMGVAGNRNAWWTDVLENGPGSPYALSFDIDWLPLKRELAGKVLLPILGDQYGAVIERGELTLEYHDGA